MTMVNETGIRDYFGGKNRRRHPRDLDQSEGGHAVLHEGADAAADMVRGLATATEALAMQRAEDQTEQHAPDTVQRTDDPAPVPTHVARDRLSQGVGNVSTAATLELRKLRDQLDDLIRDINERDAQIKNAIVSHAEFVETAIAAKTIIGEHVTKLIQQFEGSRTPLPRSQG